MARGDADARKMDKERDTLIGAARASMFVFLSFFIMFIGQGLVSPVLPLFCRSLGGGDSVVGAAVSASALGMTIFSIPSAHLTSKYGFLMPMYVASVIMSIASALSGASARTGDLPGWVWLIVTQLVYGAAYITCTLSQQVWVKREVGAGVRGRLLGAIGGCSRVAKLISPWPGGLMATAVSQRLPFFVQSGMLLAVLPVMVCLYRQQERRTTTAIRIESDGDEDERESMMMRHENGETPESAKPANKSQRDNNKSLSTSWRVTAWGFFTASVFSFTLMTLRGAIPIVLPLKGEQLNFDEERVGLALTINGLFDALFFPRSGFWADRYGRRFPCAVSMIFFVIGFVVLNIQRADEKDGAWIMMMGSVITGIGNGVSSGMVMVMGTDMSPYELVAASRFLGMWRCLSQSGNFVAPMLIGVIAGFSSLHDAISAVVVFGLFGLVWVFFLLVETKEKEVITLEDGGDNKASDGEDDGPLLAIEMMHVQDDADSCPGSADSLDVAFNLDESTER